MSTSDSKLWTCQCDVRPASALQIVDKHGGTKANMVATVLWLLYLLPQFTNNCHYALMTRGSLPQKVLLSIPTNDHFIHSVEAYLIYGPSVKEQLMYKKMCIYGHLTSCDLWSRDMDFNKTSREEACCSPTKHGEIVIEHHKERQDQERDNKIENRGDRYNRKSEVHERTVGRTCSQNEEHQVGENNIRVDTQRWKTTKRKTQKEMERWHRGSRWQSMDENGPGSKYMAQVVEAICQQWHERLRWWWWWYALSITQKLSIESNILRW